MRYSWPMNAPTLPLILLPGFMLDETLWDDVIGQLPPGMPARCLPLAPGATTDEIAQSIAHAAPARFVLVGFSLGGYIARRVAERFPERVAALILVASSLHTDSPQRAAAKQRAAEAIDPARFRGLSLNAIAETLHPGRRHDKALLMRIRDMGARLGHGALVVQSHLERGGIAAASLRCPTLVIAADEDGLRPAHETEELARAIPGARLVVIPHSGHMIPLEQPARLAGAIAGWLASIEDQLGQ